MKSRHVFVLIAALVLGLLILPTPRTAAQVDPPAGVTVETLSSFQIPVDRESTLQLLRFTFDPGTSVVMHHHPGPVIVSVLSGELTTSVADPDALLGRPLHILVARNAARIAGQLLQLVAGLRLHETVDGAGAVAIHIDPRPGHLRARVCIAALAPLQQLRAGRGPILLVALSAGGKAGDGEHGGRRGPDQTHLVSPLMFRPERSIRTRNIACVPPLAPHQNPCTRRPAWQRLMA